VAPRLAAIVAAAGIGQRLSAGRPKAVVDLGGKPLIEYAISLFRLVEAEIVIAAPATLSQAWSDQYSATDVTVVPGGSTRSQSVRAAISALPRDCTFTFVHDAARALTPVDVIHRVLEELQRGAEAVIPVLPLVDTVKEVMGEKIVRTLDRSSMFGAQTPQGFVTKLLIDAHASAKRDGVEGTDDASLIERLGVKVQTVTGDDRAFKITTPYDLEVARALLAEGGRA
jgi:2-C-methyl-D-erythritol 4-phosphate cytidylyltransferase